MTEPSRPARTPDKIRATAAALLEGSGLHIEQRRRELIVTNPRDPETGQVCITLDDAHVIWERTRTSYWGHLEGVTCHDLDTPTVQVNQIIQALTSRM
ncbi:MAG TPA: hypothetical protein VGM53_33515 [Streptosporangiaceae bacterium]|jgi:hypothetical protein